MQLTKDHIRQISDQKTFLRGLNYYHEDRVEWFEANSIGSDEIGLCAHTLGSGGQIYEQDVLFEIGRNALHIQGNCSCPVGYDCKHVVAACLAYMNSGTNTGDQPQHTLLSPDKPAGKGLSRGIEQWLNALASEAPIADSAGVSPAEDHIVYLLTPLEDRLEVQIRSTRLRKNGKGFIKGRDIQAYHLATPYLSHSVGAVLPVDRELGRLLQACSTDIHWQSHCDLQGRAGATALQTMVRTGRCYWRTIDNQPLRESPPRPLQVHWQTLPDGKQTLTTSLTMAETLVATEPAMFVDTAEGTVGLLQVEGWSAAQLQAIQNAPAITEEQAQEISKRLLLNYPELPLPLPVPLETRDNTALPIPVLTLHQIERHDHAMHAASLVFAYDDDTVCPFPPLTVLTRSSATGLVNIHRDLEREQQALNTLSEFGFRVYPDGAHEHDLEHQPLTVYPPGSSRWQSAGLWADFIEHGIPQLVAEGWRIEQHDSFALQFEAADWLADIDDDDGEGHDWFTIGFDLIVDEHRLPLAPLLTPLLDMPIEEIPNTITLPLGEHKYARIPSARITPFLHTLKELFDRVGPNRDGRLQLSRFDATTVDELSHQGVSFEGGKAIRDLGARLNNFSGIAPVEPPRQLLAELRPYQQAGLNWLQFLREYGFSGILADDMGLGKTLQTLSHLLVEKLAGRLTAPALIVAPTSLMGTWKSEAERFTPDLTVTMLHGDDRKQHFAHIDNSDVVLTTYPLLPRDKKELLKRQYHSLILDEAQAIKNPKTKMARLVRDIDSVNRLCLTGTPLENHLGELWALFDFLIPGFLGNSVQFNKIYRGPIEKHGDLERQEQLGKRILPFMLRREKNQVATELPPKTEILYPIALGREQAELYENIRVAMDKRVRQTIANQGLNRSYITILDALLKLRQVCCDPRLVKLERSKKVKASAKLEVLTGMLPDLLAEGRRVLVFSQFTSMLGLIETELNTLDIRYSKLTGQTRKREQAIEQFRSGQVSVFLISLKAGGTGLNLTEADTVILYDPWWNPAVESQAIDRAHRIGQNKPVFIYKLVVEKSVEEKMLAMQDNKRALASAMMSGQHEQEQSVFDADNLRELFGSLDQ